MKSNAQIVSPGAGAGFIVHLRLLASEVKTFWKFDDTRISCLFKILWIVFFWTELFFAYILGGVLAYFETVRYVCLFHYFPFCDGNVL